MLSDESNRLESYLLAIDAINFQVPNDQFVKINIDRDITKCFAGFSSYETSTSLDFRGISISTGHWGCGAFKGNKQIKCILIIFNLIFNILVF